MADKETVVKIMILEEFEDVIDKFWDEVPHTEAGVQSEGQSISAPLMEMRLGISIPAGLAIKYLFM